MDLGFSVCPLNGIYSHIEPALFGENNRGVKGIAPSARPKGGLDMECPRKFRPCGPWIVALVMLGSSTAGARAEMLVSAVVNQPTPGEFKATSPSHAEPGTASTTVVFRSPEHPIQPEAVRFAEMNDQQRRALVVLAVIMAGMDTYVTTSSNPTPPPGSSPQQPPGNPPVGGGTGDPNPPLQAPEPGTILLGTLGVGLIGVMRWRKSRRDEPSPLDTPAEYLAVKA